MTKVKILHSELMLMSIILVKWIFWLGVCLVFYTFLGYGLLIYLWTRKDQKTMPSTPAIENLPTVSFIIPAYNEEQWILQKIQNSIQADYPSDKIQFIVVSDGSTDRTKALIEQVELPEEITFIHYHQPERRGKIAAIERIMPTIETAVTLFTDANTMLNKKAVINMVKHFQNPVVGVVAGEKRIGYLDQGAVAATGEGVYWKYESFLKRLDYQFHSTIGAAGELFAIRTALYEPIPRDSIIEDFFMTMRIAIRGYIIAYAPDAYALESGSASVQEEMKRKIRIAAGGFQTVYRLSELCNPYKHGKLAFQFISRRYFRWIIVPILLPILFLCNAWLALQNAGVYSFIFACQVLFYLFAGGGYLLEKKEGLGKIFTIPYYFCMMHYAMYRGFFRYMNGTQTVLWERAKRA